MVCLMLNRFLFFGAIGHALAGKGGLRNGVAQNRTLMGSADPGICDTSEFQNGCDENKCYCDAGPSKGLDPGQDLSCSPFKYRPLKYNYDNQLPMYWIDEYDAFGKCAEGAGGGEPYIDTMTGYSDGGGASAWADSTNVHPTEYFVFHGCDGAGLQPDCKGDIKYIERFGGYLNGDGEGFDTMELTGMCEIPDDSTDARNFCKYVRPGSHKIYDDYSGGWWCEGTISADCVQSQATPNDWSNFPFLHDVAQKAEGGLDPSWFNGEHPFAKDGANSGVGQGKDGLRFSFMLFPWRCSENGETHNYFSYPSVPEPGHKCWVDNEPGDIGYPYYTEIYFGLLTQDAGSDVIYMLKYQTFQDQTIQTPYGDTSNPMVLTRYNDYWY